MKKCKIENLYSLNETIAADLFKGVDYPWEVLPKIHDFIMEVGMLLSKDEYEEVKEQSNPLKKQPPFLMV